RARFGRTTSPWSPSARESGNLALSGPLPSRRHEPKRLIRAAVALVGLVRRAVRGLLEVDVDTIASDEVDEVVINAGVEHDVELLQRRGAGGADLDDVAVGRGTVGRNVAAAGDVQDLVDAAALVLEAIDLTGAAGARPLLDVGAVGGAVADDRHAFSTV